MELSGWKKLFAPHILQRGLDYMESELVDIEDMDEQSIQATVQGTEPYTVEIRLQNGNVTQMSCDCPYAEEGNACKHMAAVLFAAEDAEDRDYDLLDFIIPEVQEKRKKQDEKLEQTIRALTEEQLRAFLLDAARSHSEIRDRLLFIGKKSVAPSVRKRWEWELQRISREAGDRHGFINYEHASGYVTELSLFLDRTIAPLLENRMIADAFDLVGMVYMEGMTSRIDDDGDLQFLAGECHGYWKELIADPEADQEKMFAWFQAAMRRLDEGDGVYAARTGGAEALPDGTAGRFRAGN